MLKDRLKSFILLLLVCLSIYQTGRLWFEDLSNRNFFYNMVMSKIQEYQKFQHLEQYYFTKPNRVVVCFADEEKEFAVFSHTQGETGYLQQVTKDVIKKVLQKGDYEGAFSLEELQEKEGSSLWQYPGVVLDYQFLIPFSSLVWELGIKPVSYGKQLDFFDQIWIMTNDQMPNIQYEVYFINGQERLGHVMTWKEEKNKQLLTTLIKELKSKQFWTYSSSKKDGLSKFSKNVFLPMNTKDLYINQVLFLENPFLKDGQVNEEALEQLMNPFFENYALKWMIKKEQNQYVYGDDGIIIKYFPEGMIEYSNQTIRGFKKEMSVEEAYQVAEKFLSKDQQLQNQEYELKDYEKQGDGYRFCFQYSFYDFPYVISSGIKKELGLEYPIEIWVENYQVKIYRRWILEQKDLPIYLREMQDTYIAAYDRLAVQLTEEQKQEPIQDLFLAYYQARIDENPQLSWVFRIGDQWYYERAR